MRVARRLRSGCVEHSRNVVDGRARTRFASRWAGVPVRSSMKSSTKTATIRPRWILVVGCLALFVGACSDENESAVLPNTPRQPARVGAWGFDLDGMDSAADPGSSFYAYANGGWMVTHEIPADRVAWGSFNELAASTEEQLRGLLEGLPSDAPAGTPAQQVNDYYRAYLDTEAIEAAGIGPAQAG